MFSIPKKGNLYIEDPNGKYFSASSDLTKLTGEHDIKVLAVANKSGEPSVLSIEVSAPNTLDKDTFQRNDNAAALCKTDYEKTNPRDLFNIVKLLRSAYNAYAAPKQEKIYYVFNGSGLGSVSEEQYNKFDYSV